MMRNIFKILVFVLGSFFIQNAKSQPPNDVCSGAFSITADGTCYGPGLPQTTTVGAGDHWVGTVGCAGNNDEVWFSFVATTSQLNINITSGTIGGNLEFILVQSQSPPCGGLTLGGGGGSACGASPLTSTFNGLQIGSTYYYTISSTGSAGTFTTCVTSTVPTPVSGQDCSAAAILCDATTFSQGTSNAGVGTQEVTTSNSCWGSGGERQSKWFKFTIGCTGTLEFNINPNTNSNDYDWGLWDVTSDVTCGSKGNTIACNWSGCPGATGTTSCAASEPGANNTNGNGPGGCGGTYRAFEAAVNVTAGNTYALLVDNFTTSNSGFTLTFGGACSGGTAVIGPDATFTGSLDASCLVFTGTKTCVTANSTYLWNYGDGSTSTGMNGSHTYAVAGNYTISLTVTDALGCVASYSINVANSCVLPINLASFTGEVIDNNAVKLDWVTETEINNDFFTIEKSKDGITFEVVGIVDGAGNSVVVNNYRMIDDNPLKGTSYYRLAQTDYDGTTEYSKAIAVDVKSIFGDLNVYPNPVEGTGYLSFISTDNSVTDIAIYDLSGKLVIQENYITNKGQNTLELETDNLNQGMYFISLKNDLETATIKFIKD